MKAINSFVLFITAFFVACGLFVAPPVSADPPDNSGHVWRWQDYWIYDYSANGLTVIHGADIETFCLGGDMVTGIWDAQVVENQSEIFLLMLKVKGRDIPTWIYPESFLIYGPNGFPDWEQTCPNILEFGPVAFGLADVRVTDNDWFAPMRTNRKRENTFNVSAHGALETPDGDRVIFSGGLHCSWDGYDFATFRCKARVNMND